MKKVIFIICFAIITINCFCQSKDEFGINGLKAYNVKGEFMKYMFYETTFNIKDYYDKNLKDDFHNRITVIINPNLFKPEEDSRDNVYYNRLMEELKKFNMKVNIVYGYDAKEFVYIYKPKVVIYFYCDNIEEMIKNYVG